MKKEKKNVLLIGASGGLGKALIKLLSDKKYNVICHYHSNPLELSFVSDNQLVQADITKESEVNKMVENVISTFGSIDVLINAAGVSISAMSWKMESEDWQKTIAINLTGPFACIKAVLPSMRENNFGRIINISSVVGQIGVAGTAAYAASKSGLFGMVKAVSAELGEKDVTINNIALGYFNQGMINQVPEKLKNQIIQSIPKNKLGEAEQLADCIEYLAKDSSNYITGQTLNLNGGMYGN